MSNYDIAWDETTPTGSEARSLGDDRIREIKAQLRQRLSTEHSTLTDETGDKELIHLAGQCTILYVGTTAEIAALTNSFATANLCCIAFDTTLGALKYFNGTAWTVLPFDWDSIWGAGDSVHSHISDAEGGTLTGLGAWETKSNNTVYLAATDGFVTAWVSSTNAEVFGYTDSSNPPTTARLKSTYNGASAGGASITLPVKKGEYWKVTGAVTVYWIPFGV